MNMMQNLKKNSRYELQDETSVTYLGTKTVTGDDGKKRDMCRIQLDDGTEVLRTSYDFKKSIKTQNVLALATPNNAEHDTIETEKKIVEPVLSEQSHPVPKKDTQNINPVINNAERKRDGFFKEMKDGFLWWLGVRSKKSE